MICVKMIEKVRCVRQTLLLTSFRSLVVYKMASLCMILNIYKTAKTLYKIHLQADENALLHLCLGCRVHIGAPLASYSIFELTCI